MDEARTRAQWNHTSHLLAWIQNTVATAGNLVTPQDLNPYAEDDVQTAPSGLTITPQVLRAMVKAMKMRHAKPR
jgi:hypothetical protein